MPSDQLYTSPQAVGLRAFEARGVVICGEICDVLATTGDDARPNARRSTATSYLRITKFRQQRLQRCFGDQVTVPRRSSTTRTPSQSAVHCSAASAQRQGLKPGRVAETHAPGTATLFRAFTVVENWRTIAPGVRRDPRWTLTPRICSEVRHGSRYLQTLKHFECAGRQTQSSSSSLRKKLRR